MRMGAGQSWEFDKLASLQIGKGFADIGCKRREIGVILFGQRADDLAYCSSIAAGKNFLRSFVQFEDAFREKQYAFACGGVDLQPDSARQSRLGGISDFQHMHDELY